MKVYAVAANGTEEAELLVVVDLLIRAGMDVKTVSIEGENEITSSHGIILKTDINISETLMEDADVVFIPGGMPGSERLSKCDKLITIIDRLNKKQKLITAICAAPALVLGHHHFLKGKNATCFPGFEEYLKDAKKVEDGVVKDTNIITARGLGFAIPLGIKIIESTLGIEKAREIEDKIQYK